MVRSDMAHAPPLRPRRVTGVTGDKPPPLDLDLRRRLLTLVLANVLPMLAVAVIAIGIAQGKWTIKASAGNGLAPLLMIFGSCVVLVASWWMVMPFGRWLRDRPRWHYHHGSHLIWAVPYAAGWCAWIVLWMSGMAAAVGALAMLGVSSVKLFQVWHT